MLIIFPQWHTGDTFRWLQEQTKCRDSIKVKNKNAMRYKRLDRVTTMPFPMRHHQRCPAPITSVLCEKLSRKSKTSLDHILYRAMSHHVGNHRGSSTSLCSSMLSVIQHHTSPVSPRSWSMASPLLVSGLDLDWAPNPSSTH